jgi:hypothetical protein
MPLAASSNGDNAYRLKGDLLLVVVNQLIKHDRDFDLLYIPGAGHGSGGAYGEHKRFDFFVRHLLGVEPPKWSAAGLSRTDER